jgi:outer membrane immunogenic protein
MRRILLAAIAAAGISVSAQAADMPIKGPVYKAAPVVYNWTGAYIGASGGFAWGSTRWTNAVATTTGDFDTDGGLLGLTLGYNWQARGSRYVFGIEGDISWADISGSTATSCGAATPCVSTIQWLSTIRGRLGYAHNNWMLFATGGLALAGVDYFGAGGVDANQVEVGWTVGAGIEAALSGRWTVKAEYLFVSLDRSDVFFAPTGIIANFNDNHIVRGGINYRF